MDVTGINWATFGWTLAAAFLFGIFYAAVVRWASRHHLVGQTAWAVVVGVSVTLALTIPVLGISLVAIIGCYFIATGLPMILEYILRVQDELAEDRDKSKGYAKDLLK